MTTLVIGGAGYIGSHVVRLLLEQKQEVVVVDDLSTGLRRRTEGAELLELDVTLPDAREKLAFQMRACGADSVIHFAAHKQVGESVANRSEEHTSELQSRFDLVCRLLLEKKKEK